MKKLIKKVAVICASVAMSANAGFAQIEIISNNSVGIGTTTPAHKLHVVGNNYVTGNSYVGGNFGVGTTAPSQKLHIVGNSYFNGKIGISTTLTPLSPLSINSAGNAAHQISVVTTSSSTEGVYAFRAGGSISVGVWVNAVRGNSEVTAGNHNVGVRGDAYMATAQGTGRAFGVLGRAGNSSNGFNYGTLGILEGTQKGTGIYGSVGVWPVGISGQYAGYFEGDVHVTGTLSATSTNFSDKRLKKNIVLLDNSALNKVLQMNPVEYNYTQTILRTATHEGDTLTPEIKMFDEKAQMFQKKHYGLIAQELEQLYPDLVYTNSNGYLSVNYIDIIPLLIQSIKEQNNNIEMLQKEVKSLQTTNKMLKSNEITTTQDISDTQNSETLIPIIVEALKEQRLEVEKKQAQIDKLQEMIQTLNAKFEKIEQK